MIDSEREFKICAAEKLLLVKILFKESFKARFNVCLSLVLYTNVRDIKNSTESQCPVIKCLYWVDLAHQFENGSSCLSRLYHNTQSTV